jgi:hypothetical protein
MFMVHTAYAVGGGCQWLAREHHWPISRICDWGRVVIGFQPPHDCEISTVHGMTSRLRRERGFLQSSKVKVK